MAGTAKVGRAAKGRRWLVRGALAGAVALLAAISIQDTAAQVAARTNLQLAHMLDPGAGRIAGRLAERTFAAEMQAAPDSRAAKLALQALRNDPTAVEAAATLALLAQLRGDQSRSDALFAYANTLSQRELRPQLWAIEQAVTRGDVEGALRHYDIALTTSRGAEDLLFPVLEKALREPLVRRTLLEKLASQPVWTRGFVNYAAITVSDPAATIDFFRSGQSAGLPIQEAERTAIVNAVAARGQHNLAWSYYSSFRPQALRTHSRDAEFMGTQDNPAVFDWVLRYDTGAIASLQGGEEGGLLDFSAPPGSSGALVDQLQILPAGQYRLEGRSAGIDLADDERPYWLVTCASGRELARIPVPNSDVNGGRFSGTVRVPAGCPVQTLSLIVRSSNRIAGASGQFEFVRLVPSTGSTSSAVGRS